MFIYFCFDINLLPLLMHLTWCKITCNNKTNTIHFGTHKIQTLGKLEKVKPIYQKKIEILPEIETLCKQQLMIHHIVKELFQKREIELALAIQMSASIIPR